ncbi:uncharacterized protein LOC111324314 [Stylophora pistillata]|uniref:UPAR/Ly6 domain-containing protein n=1 Tax=Stylophora pistillata TaxID=50429 RepID=A0A2B4SJ37_STYPI|nr:uncharacterized protein LOC111324314 [Stylophora pistillata]PFX29901.1 hypothetical protein AWC38_SpisGene5362 [Stylophora pistillata]
MKLALELMIYFLILLAYGSQVVLALRCFKCESDRSWIECDLDEKKTVEECSEEQIRCSSIMLRANPREKLKYSKGCVNRLHNPCHQKRVDDCRSTFCDSELCNFALTPEATLIASGFRCFRCNSTKSWDDCVSKAEEVFCNTGYRKCFKMKFRRDNGVIEYSKGCTVPLDNSSTTRRLADRRDLYLCGQHLCNGATIVCSPMMVIFGPLLLVMMVLFFYLKTVC